MHLNENSRFIFLTLGVFCLTLGIAILLFSLIERILFRQGFIGIFVGASSFAIAIGIFILVLTNAKTRRREKD